MPLYDVEHTTSLTSSQRDALAMAITKIHSEKFTTPKLFVNVRFVDLRQRKGEAHYVAGKEKVRNASFFFRPALDDSCGCRDVSLLLNVAGSDALRDE